jgi:glucose dehydrogenase
MIPYLFALSLVALGCTPTHPPASHEWRYYGADSGSQRFSSLDQIDSTNVADLRVV